MIAESGSDRFSGRSRLRVMYYTEYGFPTVSAGRVPRDRATILAVSRHSILRLYRGWMLGLSEGSNLTHATTDGNERSLDLPSPVAVRTAAISLGDLRIARERASTGGVAQDLHDLRHDSTPSLPRHHDHHNSQFHRQQRSSPRSGRGGPCSHVRTSSTQSIHSSAPLIASECLFLQAARFSSPAM